MTPIDVFAEIACPFTHVSLRRVVAERAARGVTRDLRVRAWPLQLVNGKPLDPGMVADEVAALRDTVASELFRGFDRALVPSSSMLAFGLAGAAYEVDCHVGEAVSLAIRDALFEEGRDVASPGVLREVGARFDVEMVSEDEAETIARRDWKRGKERGVQGSPHFFVEGGNWFCPGLDIAHEHGRFDIERSPKQLDAFLQTAFA